MSWCKITVWSSNMGLVGQFRSSVWDPTMICAQIVTMQSIYYVTFGFWLVLVDYIAGADRSLDQIFGYEVSVLLSRWRAKWVTDHTGNEFLSTSSVNRTSLPSKRERRNTGHNYLLSLINKALVRDRCWVYRQLQTYNKLHLPIHKFI